MEGIAPKLLRFVLVGGFCAVIFFAVDYVLLQVARLPLAAALAITYAVCFGLGYGLQRNVAFRSTGSHKRSLPRYLVMHASGMIFVYFATLLLRPYVGFGAAGAPLIATGLAGLASFVISLTWVFAQPASIVVER